MLYLQKYSELPPRIWHAFIILTKVILGIFWAILETDTWELLSKLVELTRNDPKLFHTLMVLCENEYFLIVSGPTPNKALFKELIAPPWGI